MACSVYRTMKDFDLRDLDAFVAVARTRNFRRAAIEQGVSVSSLSQRLRDMEERLGVRLMNRTTRSVALTEAGELLLARVGPAMSDVGAALDQVRGLRAVPSGRLRINAPPPAIDLVLAPMVAPFLASLSQDRSGDRRRELVRRYRGRRFRRRRALWRASGAGHDRGLARRRRSATRWWPRANTSRSMEARNIRRICWSTPASAPASAAARCWIGSSRRPGRVVKVSPPAKLIATYPGLALRAVHDGIGFWLTFEGYVRYGIKSGALVSVLEDWCAPFPGPFLYYPSRRQPPPALAAFVAFVAEWRKQERRKGQGRQRIELPRSLPSLRDPGTVQLQYLGASIVVVDHDIGLLSAHLRRGIASDLRHSADGRRVGIDNLEVFAARRAPRQRDIEIDFQKYREVRARPQFGTVQEIHVHRSAPWLARHCRHSRSNGLSVISA